MSGMAAALAAASAAAVALSAPAANAATLVTFEGYELGDQPTIEGFRYASGEVVDDPLGINGKVLKLNPDYPPPKAPYSTFYVGRGEIVTPPDYLSICGTLFGGCKANYENRYVKGYEVTFDFLMPQGGHVTFAYVPEITGSWQSTPGSITQYYGLTGNRLVGREVYIDNLRLEAVYNYLPEPTTWATLIMGFGAIGSSLRRRTRRPHGARASRTA